LTSRNEDAVTRAAFRGDTVKNSANIRVLIREISRPFKSRHAWRLFASGLCIHGIMHALPGRGYPRQPTTLHRDIRLGDIESRSPSARIDS